MHDLQLSYILCSCTLFNCATQLLLLLAQLSTSAFRVLSQKEHAPVRYDKRHSTSIESQDSPLSNELLVYWFWFDLYG